MAIDYLKSIQERIIQDSTLASEVQVLKDKVVASKLTEARQSGGPFSATHPMKSA